MNLQFAICNFSVFRELSYCVSIHYKEKTDEKIANCKLQFLISQTTTLCISIHYINITGKKNCKLQIANSINHTNTYHANADAIIRQMLTKRGILVKI